MVYDNISSAVFLSRPNRFIANVLIDGRPFIAHVKNTGRCRELLISGASVIVQKAKGQGRKTDYDLIAVYKGERLINIDSQAPNKVFYQWLKGGGLGEVPSLIKAEQRFGDSRFDFYLERGSRRAFAEVKGVTLEENGLARFPDAPTERGVKHLHGLMDCLKKGYEAYAVFIIQMDKVHLFEPNRLTHPEFADTLIQAEKAGVRLLALDCEVKEDNISAQNPVPIHLC